MPEQIFDKRNNLLVEGVLLNNSNKTNKEANDCIALLKRDRILKPVIYVGVGTCGEIAGASKTIAAVNEYLEEKGIDADIVPVGCIGMCTHEPLLDFQIPGKTRISFKNITYEKVGVILDGMFNNIIPEEDVLGQFKNDKLEPWEHVPFLDEQPFFALQTRNLLKNSGFINPFSIEEYIACGGYKVFIKTIRHYTSEDICNIIEKSELRGRGGGGYNTGKKWKVAYAAPSDQKYLICNADESDPGGFMDRSLIEGDPHRLIEGIAIAAYAIGASKAYIFARARYKLVNERIEKAIELAREYGILGHNIFGSGFNLDITLRKGAGAYVCGEETALINSIEGKRGMPRSKPPYPATSGLFGKPTVINNVETLCNIPLIVENGPDWFRSLGTENSKGTKLFSVSGKVAITGLVEVEMGTSMRDIIYKILGGVANNKKLKTVHIGGPSGGCITEENLDIQIDYESLQSIGANMGSGGVVVFDENTCVIDVAKFFMNFIQNESCGKCIPCREGSRRMMEVLERITKKPINETGYETLERFKGVMQLESLAEVMKDTSLCGLGQTAANPILSTLKWFRQEYEEHIFDRKCAAGVCKDLRTFIIDVDKCTGCTACLRKCPTDAIIGTKRQPHFIVESKCIGCGSCYETCKFSAIFIK